MTIPPTTEAPDLDALPNEEKRVSPMKNYTDEDLPPLRLNATRVPERLSSSTSALSSLSHIRRRSNEWSKPRSRSRSPSMRDTENSSISSIDTDSDIYTDRMGLEELDAEKMHKSTADGSISSLPPVHERMSEDMLEDVHAFSDISKQSSRANSVATCGEVGSLVLETLDECDDEDYDAVHISNLDHIHEESETPNLDEDQQQSAGQTYFFTTEDLPPLRLNACRVPDKFSHSVSSFFDTNNRRTGLPDNLTSKSKMSDYNSNSSFDGLDQDILTDRMAFQELEKTSMSTSVSSLQAVNERMESDTLDDVHAFSDVLSKASSSGRSGANSIATGGDVGSLLETLDEGEEDDDDHDHDHDPEDGGVHISNLENLTIRNDATDSNSIGINKSSDAKT